MSSGQTKTLPAVSSARLTRIIACYFPANCSCQARESGVKTQDEQICISEVNFRRSTGVGFVGHGPVSASRVVISLYNVRARVSAVSVDGSVRGRGVGMVESRELG